MSDLIDHKALAISRLATEYRESDNLIDYIKTLLLEADNLEVVYQDLLTKRWIDTAEGVQLDIIGSIVGQSRDIIDADILVFFGFQGALGVGGYGDEGDTSQGARFRSEDENTSGNVRLADPEYRIFIRARILKNSTLATSNDVAEHAKFLFEAPSVFVTDIGEASARVTIGKMLTLNEKAYLINAGLLPKPAGVAYTFAEYEEGEAFGFFGAPNVKGFADEATPTNGGKFAAEF